MNNNLSIIPTNNATILTPTRRLAEGLLVDLAQASNLTLKVWPTPPIYALEDWLAKSWEQVEIKGLVDSLLLTASQSLLLIEEIIVDSPLGKSLLQPHIVAKSVYAAWKILHHWRSLALLELTPENNDQAAFQQWIGRYQSILQEKNYLDEVMLPEYLLTLIKEQGSNCLQQISPVSSLLLYGFEELPPLLDYFFIELTTIGWQLTRREPTIVKAEKINKVALASKEQEWQTVAEWAKSLVEQNNVKVAVVTPHLTDQRNQIERVFNDLFAPLSACSPEATVNPWFNISAAIPLIQYPLIYDAFAILKIGQKSIAYEDYKQFMQSPFVFAAEEEAVRLLHLAEVKAHGDKKWSLKEILTLANVRYQVQLTKTLSILQPLFNYLINLPSLLSFYEWANHFRALLSIAGWPGEKPLSSIMHQLVKRFDALLNELSYCDIVLKKCDYQTALQYCQKLAANIPFQPENKGAPIQILGMLEAAGQQFDYLWVMGLHNEAWPPIAQPNPFIPIAYQRKLKMPHASAEREMEYAAKVTERLKYSAMQVYFSYPLQEKEQQFTASELINEYPEGKVAPSDSFVIRRAEDFFTTSNALEIYLDHCAPLLSENEQLRATSSLLTLQASCPFKAFAELRLNAKLTSFSKWLTPAKQGQIIHAILEALWRELQTQQALLCLSMTELEKKLDLLITKQLGKMVPHSLPTAYLAVEKKRIKAILLQYLNIEKKRAPFKVLALENKRTISLLGLEFMVRLDRLDLNEENQTILIDYKTGQFKVNDLWGEKPRAPQLPLYFLAINELKPQALVVIKLNGQQTQFEGICAQEIQISGIKALSELKDTDIPSTWDELKMHWLKVLERLVAEFKNGHAAVQPREPQICQYCDLSSFCRIKIGKAL